ncbi:hypothetical protein DY218_27135 [Streptomyces triticagri]|uniref:Uncharacterized protein n=1 Tax=Streptomyces triticagri TaxID=2293568 RepID=A0A372LZA6_9ACTN|nr:hypothetical protein DY218_27135 [Streptomyces triticagri]
MNPESSYRAEWQRRMRAECLHFVDRARKTRKPAAHRKAIADVFGVALWCSTYANPDGTRAFPEVATLAALTGMSEERTRNCLKVALLAGAMSRKRRKYTSSEYRLDAVVGPVGALPVERHLHLVTETRSKDRHLKQKALDAEQAAHERAAQDIENRVRARTSEPQEPVPARDSDESETRARRGSSIPETRARTPQKPVRARIEKPVRAGGVQIPDTGPPTDLGGETVFQPEVSRGAAPANDEIPANPDDVVREIAAIDVWLAEHQCSGGCADDAAVYRRRYVLERTLHALRPHRRGRASEQHAVALLAAVPPARAPETDRERARTLAEDAVRTHAVELRDHRRHCRTCWTQQTCPEASVIEADRNAAAHRAMDAARKETA